LRLPCDRNGRYAFWSGSRHAAGAIADPPPERTLSEASKYGTSRRQDIDPEAYAGFRFPVLRHMVVAQAARQNRTSPVGPWGSQFGYLSRARLLMAEQCAAPLAPPPRRTHLTPANPSRFPRSVQDPHG
jgi:hypothetical protein